MSRDLRAKIGRPAHRALTDFVDRLPDFSPLLGLTHVTSSYLLRDMLASGRIEATEECQILNENVIYAFYGRASFRGRAEFAPASLASLFPSVLILDPAKVPIPKYIFPFDSGAFMGGLMDVYLHPYMPLFDFILAPDLKSAARLIGASFGSSENYLVNRPLSSFSVPPANFEADSYRRMVLATETGELDDRASTPEIVFADPLELTKCVVAAVLPDTLASEPSIGGVLKSHGIDVHEYIWTSASRPNEHHFVIRNLVKGIYQKQGWL